MKTFMAGMKEYFGFKTGQTLKEFSEEIKCLSHAERMQFSAMLNKAGVESSPPMAPTPVV